MIKFKNYYEILGVTPDSSNAEIKSAYRRLARKYHPDVNPSTAELFKDITEAYTTLINPEKRRQYNILNGFLKTKRQRHLLKKQSRNTKKKQRLSQIKNKKKISSQTLDKNKKNILKKILPIP